MSELNVIIPYCCITGKYCSYNNGFVEGYLVGLVTVLCILSLIGIINDLNDRYKYKDDEDEPKNDTSGEEEDVQLEKSEEDKKDE